VVLLVKPDDEDLFRLFCVRLINAEPTLKIKISTEEIPGLFHINMTHRKLEGEIKKVDIIPLVQSVNINTAVITDLALVPFETMLNRLITVGEGLHCHNIQKNVACRVVKDYFKS
jgi:hypothetical protein